MKIYFASSRVGAKTKAYNLRSVVSIFYNVDIIKVAVLPDPDYA